MRAVLLSTGSPSHKATTGCKRGAPHSGFHAILPYTKFNTRDLGFVVSLCQLDFFKIHYLGVAKNHYGEKATMGCNIYKGILTDFLRH